jgi:ATP-binding protein involved in chromosome partitioning
MPTQMLGIASGRPESADSKRLPPMDAQGIQAVSISFLRDPEQPMV